MKTTSLLSNCGAALTLAIALALPGCSFAQEAPLVSEAVAAVEVAPTGPALWQLSDEDTTIYLFGTVHILPAGLDWFDARIEQAFTSSDILVTEVDTDDEAAIAQAIAQNAMLETGGTLRELMTEENRAQYEAAMSQMGLPVAALDQFEPWFAALNLGVLPLLQAGYDPSAGVESDLSARAGDMPRGSLETVQQQIDLFDGMETEYQLTYLDTTVESVPEVITMVDSMVAEWLEGDADALAEIMNGEIDDTYLYERLLIDRNANWVEWIEERMGQPGTVFIAVGAGHLAGEGSVQDQLGDRGHVVTRVP